MGRAEHFPETERFIISKAKTLALGSPAKHPHLTWSLLSWVYPPPRDTLTPPDNIPTLERGNHGMAGREARHQGHLVNQWQDPNGSPPLPLTASGGKLIPAQSPGRRKDCREVWQGKISCKTGSFPPAVPCSPHSDLAPGGNPSATYL